ncbi:MAG: Rieske 2Fe-2S domain-containing protein [Chloroflexota bacterium]|nr:Rieske 2Fe-2S domain-containing protein [Chloroflexota bacterium]
MVTINPSSPAEQTSRSGPLILVGPRAALTGVTVVSGGRHGIAVFPSSTSDAVYAVDNRCPHMGFPLHKGSVADGILTCHWHHARFDLESGGTFDPWADDVQTYETVIDDGIVYVDPRPRGNRASRARGRLQDGLEQRLNLVIVKSVLALQEADQPAAEMVVIGARFGATYRAAGWGPGLTILTAMGNLLPALAANDQALALYHGLVHVARDCAGEPPRFVLDPLPTEAVPASRLKTWFRRFIEVRDADGAERVLLTAIATGLSPAALADLLAAAATDHYYLDGGHTLDFINKACELLDQIGWDQAATVLPSVVPVLAASRRSEELNTWRHPIDLIALLASTFADLPEMTLNSAADWQPPTDLTATLLSDDPVAIIEMLDRALASGAPATALSQAVSQAAALRVARFHTANEFADWIAVLHTFSHANAVHQLLKRAPSTELLRGVYHGAMRLYLDRFLNTPPARLPEMRPADLANLPGDAPTLLAQLEETLDREQQSEPAALIVWRYLELGHDPAPLIASLGHLLLREDGEFHSYQMLEAGIALHDELRQTDPAAAGRVLIGVARYLAAHAPTSRAMLQTARIALRLQRGDDLTLDPDDASNGLAAS